MKPKTINQNNGQQTLLQCQIQNQQLNMITAH